MDIDVEYKETRTAGILRSGGERDYLDRTMPRYLVTARGDESTNVDELKSVVRDSLLSFGIRPAVYPPTYASHTLVFEFNAKETEEQIRNSIISTIKDRDLRGHLRKEDNSSVEERMMLRYPEDQSRPSFSQRSPRWVSPSRPRSRVSNTRIFRILRRRFWSLTFLVIFLGLFAFSYYNDKAAGTLHSDYFVGTYSLIIWSEHIPFPLIIYSLIFAFVIFIPLRIFGWGVRQVIMRHYGKGIMAIIVITLVTGFAVSNSPYPSIIPPSYTFYQAVKGLNSQPSPDNVSTVTVTSYNTSMVVTTSSEPTTNNVENWLVDPSFSNGVATISYPPNYSALVNYTLSLINSDRKQAGLLPVTLSSVASGQQHADSMAYFGYFSHWDVQGYKPYMRYTLLGGTGYVVENAGMGYCTDSVTSAQLVTPTSCTLQTIENGIANSEYSMMNYDSTCCNNGHRENILDPSHTSVSIGIAYNSQTYAIYFVEDFVDSYISNLSLHLSDGVVTLQGNTQQDFTGWTGSSSGASIQVYYDPMPQPIPVSELNVSANCSGYNELSEPASCQYAGAYDSGLLVTTVLAPCPAGYICGSNSGFSYAQVWEYSGGSFDIVFSLPQSGSGVYTLYLWPNGGAAPITSLSVFV